MKINLAENIETAETDHNEIKLAFCPAAPTKIEELDIPRSLVEDLMLRYLYTKGSSSIHDLSLSLNLPFSILHELFQQLRQKHLFEVTGMDGNDYIFTLSGIGRELAKKRFTISHYCGPTPVSMANYRDAVLAQVIRPKVNRELLTSALEDLVLTDNFLNQLGPAIASQKSIFLYGPTGNGKTSIASRLFRIYQDPVVLPYAIEVDGQIIVLYDPVIHKKLDIDITSMDQRWALCFRPCIITGGELEPQMLELQMEENSKVYAAPLQMKANNGIIVIDDFGRQKISPIHLLNRWIVPLDRRVDYLTLRYGLKFQIPFEMIVVFSTNLDPNDLADEAFLRRIQNKIYVDAVGKETFEKIFQREVSKRDLPCDSESGKVLRKLCLDLGAKELRACYPSDIINIIISINAYEEHPVIIDREGLERAAELYFTKPKALLKN
jgi:predicted ATPase with chaperone activity